VKDVIQGSGLVCHREKIVASGNRGGLEDLQDSQVLFGRDCVDDVLGALRDCERPIARVRVHGRDALL